MTSENTRTNPTHFRSVAEVVAEHLGTENRVSVLCQEALASGDPAAVDRALLAVRSLPTIQRDHIFATANVRMKEDADALNFVLRGQFIHPDETKH